ncbi:MAG: DUF2318 domain-containing protein [Desulfuromonadaceae bacterium]
MMLLRSAISLALLWGGLSWCLLEAGETGRLRRRIVLASSFTAGAVGMLTLLAAMAGDPPFAILRMLVAALLLAMVLVSSAALFTAPGRGDRSTIWRERCAGWGRQMAPFLFPALNGALATAILAGSPSPSRLTVVAMTVVTAFLVATLVDLLIHLLPYRPRFTTLTLFLLASSLLFCSAAFSPRLDLFAPLSMKIMKFTHDFLHQFMESMLLPDHLFINPPTWNFIGFFFSQEIGFWGALLLWFAPVALVCLVVSRMPLPSVAHVRQGALRRSLIAAALRERRGLLIMPAAAALLLVFSVYRSLSPDVLYWDPAPIAVAATPAGDIAIPLKQGELDLRDRKLHKFSYSQGKTVVRFFVLDRGDAVVVVLDACAICAPEGYGQGEGSVLCYYCKTLIPLETVGRPGGCNPVSVPFTSRDQVLRISAQQLVNLWNSTVQVTTKKNARGKR